MNNLKILFFGKFSLRINNITICKALDYLSSQDPRFLEGRKNCLDIEDVFDDLEFELGFLDIVLGNIKYLQKTDEYKCPIYSNNRKIGILIIDSFGSARVMYDKLQAMELNSFELERQIKSILTSSRGELIDTLMTMLQFTRPIPLSTDTFLLNISAREEALIIEFFNRVFASRPGETFDKPYFIGLEKSSLNAETISSLIADRMNEVLKAFENTKNEFYDGVLDDMSLEDIQIIDRLISLTKEDILFYENILSSSILNKLDKEI